MLTLALVRFQFVDGTSTVERTVTRTANIMYAGGKSLGPSRGDKENVSTSKRGGKSTQDNDGEEGETTVAGGESFDLSGVQESQSQESRSVGRAKGRQPLVGR